MVRMGLLVQMVIVVALVGLGNGEHGHLWWDESFTTMASTFSPQMEAMKMDPQREYAAMGSPVDFHFLRTQIACSSGDLSGALESLDYVLAHAPSNSAYLLAARIAAGTGDFVTAVERYAAIALAPHSSDLSLSLDALLGIRNALSRLPPGQNNAGGALPFVELTLVRSFQLLLRQKGMVIDDPTAVAFVGDVGSSRSAPAFWFGEENQDGQVAEHVAAMEENKYVLLKGVVTPTIVSVYAMWFKEILDTFGPEPHLGRTSLDADPLGALFDAQLAHKVAAITGIPLDNLVPTYSYVIYYQDGGHIGPHTDRIQNELSLSFNVDCPPEWPLHVYPDGEGGRVEEYFMAPGDGVLYRGAEVMHARPVWRGGTCLQLVVGWRRVDAGSCNSQ